MLQPDETSGFLRNVDVAARQVASERRKKLFRSFLVECDFVELIKKMWDRHLRPEVFEPNLPDYIYASMNVMF